MDLIYTILIWGIIGLTGIVGFIYLLITDRGTITRFVLWFIASLMVMLFINEIINNDFIKIFINALIVSFMAVKA